MNTKTDKQPTGESALRGAACSPDVSDTTETDALLRGGKSAYNADVCELLDLCRKLERERDEAVAEATNAVHTEAEIGDVVSWAMKETTLEKVRQALQAGIENTDQLLMDHDRSLGRTTRKNKVEAERLEQDIRDMKNSLESLMAPDGRFFPFIEDNAQCPSVGATE